MRRSFIILASFGVAAVIAFVTLPWWLGAAAGAIAPRFGLTFSDYERMGYGRFKLENVEVRRPGVYVHIDEAEAPTPVVWLWQRMAGNSSEVIGGAWRVEVDADELPPKPEKPRGWVPLTQTLRRTAERLDLWLPRATTGAGVVTWKKGELTIGPAVWRERTLTTPSVAFKALEAAAKFTLSEEGKMRLELEAPQEEAAAMLESEGVNVAGEVAWWGVKTVVGAEFLDTGWQPLAANLRAEAWEIPGERAGIGAQYGILRGDALIEWRDERLSARVSVEGVPVDGANAPPLRVQVRGHGEDGLFVAETVEAELPGVTARLSEPLRIDRRGRVQSEPAGFAFDVDLARLAWIEASGALRGEGNIGAGEDGRARVTFSVTGEALALSGVDVARFETRGAFEWPRLDIATATLVGGDGRELVASGGWDFRARTISAATVRGEIGRATLARWLPENPQFEAIEVEASAEGSWPAMVHEGRVSVEQLAFPKMKPVAFAGNWRGRGERVEHFEATATAGATSVTAAGVADAEQMELSRLDFVKGEEALLQLEVPAALRWAERRAGPFRLSAARRGVEATMAWGESGEFNLQAHGVRSEWLGDLVALPAIDVLIDVLAARGSWSGELATYAANGKFDVGFAKDRSAQVAVELSGGSDGLKIGALRVAEGSGVIMEASGHLPVMVRPGGEALVDIDENARLELKAQSSSNPEFWAKVTELTGVELVRPEAVINLRGRWNDPRGEARLSVERIAPLPGRFKAKWPAIDALEAHFVADGNGAKLEPLSVKLNGQTVRVRGRVPVSPAEWRKVWKNPLMVAERGALNIQIVDAELAAVAQQFPDLLAPKGRLHLDLTVRPDAMLEGELRVRDGTSRPLGPLGVLQDINAEVRFNGRAAELASVTARMGGQPVMLQGRAELPVEGGLQLDLALKGTNLPFVRRTGLLLRGDLDLTLKSSASGRTAIGGTVRLRDSMFLADLRSLIPSGAKGSAARPPYFSIEAEPLNAWQLNVNVTGARFLRLRTPVFNGTASMGVRLDGTLENPRATGEVVIDEGRVRLPFAAFEVRQGHLRLTPDQAEPRLLVMGATRRYGYDLRMELSGPASAPELTFSSSPPLEAEQVLLLVMTGQPPTEEITATDRQRVTRLGAFFGQSLLGSFAGDSDGADRLTFSSGEDISAQGRETYSIEYRLSNRWAVTGEYDEFDDYYGGLKWRIYPKEGGADERP